MNLVSVIVPVYNTEKFLESCVNSIISQTYKEIEIILVDDGSTDKSGNICDTFKKDNRVKVYHRQNSGPSASRNFALKQASGDFLMFCDSDDMLDEQAIEASMDSIVDADLCLFPLVEFNHHNKSYYEKRLFKADRKEFIGHEVSNIIDMSLTDRSEYRGGGVQLA